MGELKYYQQNHIVIKYHDIFPRLEPKITSREKISMHGKNAIIGCGYGWRKENQVLERKIPLRVFCNNMNIPRQKGYSYRKMKRSKHYLRYYSF